MQREMKISLPFSGYLHRFEKKGFQCQAGRQRGFVGAWPLVLSVVFIV